MFSPVNDLRAVGPSRDTTTATISRQPAGNTPPTPQRTMLIVKVTLTAGAQQATAKKKYRLKLAK